MGHTMSILNPEELLMVGGVAIPDAGPVIHHPKDSSFWIFIQKEKVRTNMC